MKVFNKYKKTLELEYNVENKSILLCDNSNDRHINATLRMETLQFNDTYMILYPISWVRYIRWKRKMFIKHKLTRRAKGIWKDMIC